MIKIPSIFLLFAVFCFVRNNEVSAEDGNCDRRPLGTKTEPLIPDDRFMIDVDGITGNQYIPMSKYNVRLFSRDGQSTFIAFTISIREDTKPNEKNPRRPIPLQPGVLMPLDTSTDTISSPNCNNTVIQSNITPKTSVTVSWIAPPKDNKCVTIYAVLAVKPGVWYDYEGPLSKRICEDTRKADDMQPTANDNCQVCEDARYQLTFEGLWSYNTHPLMFPATRDLARFSDVVGASHGNGFHVWSYNGDASVGLKELAQQGNTTILELEIQERLGSDVRTIIKATGPPKPSMSTTALFRVTKQHHLVSLVTAIQPSPDWFLGVADLELCEVTTGPPRWANSVRLNLYPMDAGTDNGRFFEAPNEDTSPQQTISGATINKNIPKEKTKPFARLHFQLIRTYAMPSCDNVTESDNNVRKNDESTAYGQYDNAYPGPVTTTSEEPPPPDPESAADCPMTSWEEWLPCEGICEEGTLKGYQIRVRYHIVEGVVVGKYVNGKTENADVQIPQACSDQYPDNETRECEESCEAESSAPQRRRPGESW